jgi:hypothetical protein
MFPTTDSSETIALCLENEAMKRRSTKTLTGIQNSPEETGFVLDQ